MGSGRTRICGGNRGPRPIAQAVSDLWDRKHKNRTHTANDDGVEDGGFLDGSPVQVLEGLRKEARRRHRVCVMSGQQLLRKREDEAIAGKYTPRLSGPQTNWRGSVRRNAVVIQPDYSNDVDGAARMSKLGHLVMSRDMILALLPLLVLVLAW